MTSDPTSAEEASEIVFEEIKECLAEGRDFLLEAGAGSGKTHSLIETLNYLAESEGDELVRNKQKIACITYTNVAADQIISRTNSHPAIYATTIHGFCWSLVKNFQPFLRKNMYRVFSSWDEEDEESINTHHQEVVYDEGYRGMDDKIITLHHDDVLFFMVMLLENPEFIALFSKWYPFLFIDEYQDTNTIFAKSLIKQFLDNNFLPLIGLFGDHWQKIYPSGFGKITHPNLKIIKKEANFRSVPLIVNALNRIRPDLPQQPEDPYETSGSISVFHTNNWVGNRLTGKNWEGDLPEKAAHEHLNYLVEKLEETEGWNFSPEKTRILMLTHRYLASVQGYKNLFKVFSGDKDLYLKKRDPHIAFIVDELEPLCHSLIKSGTATTEFHTEKEGRKKDMGKLFELRENGTIGEVIDHLLETRRPYPSEAVVNKEEELKQWRQQGEENIEESIFFHDLEELRSVPYMEAVHLSKFVSGSTPFSTKHNVKGEEFENVLVIFHRGWSDYDFNRFLVETGFASPPNPDSDKFYERNRNLFYVACSRAQVNLCLFFTQRLSPEAIETLECWFGEDAVQPLEIE